MSATKGITKHCDKCNSQIGTYSFKKHYNKCDGSGLRVIKYGPKDIPVKCKFCDLLFKPYGMQNHVRMVHEGRTNAIITGKSAWNKGRFKARFCLNGTGNHKAILIQERGHRCEKCQNDLWLGIPISLQLEHKDGNHYNNVKENLELLCPNCHSQTLTYNRRKTAAIVSDEQFINILKTTENIHQCLRVLGLNTSSTNYSRAKRLLSKV